MEGPRILCNCGRSLGDLYDVFREMKARKIQENIKKLNREIKPNELDMVGDFELSLDDELTQLRIEQTCCRSILLTQVMPRDIN